MVRIWVACAAVVGTSAPAAAEPDVQVAGPPPSAAFCVRCPAASASAALGGGFRADQPTANLDLAGDLAAGRLSIGLGARLRTIADRFATRDWDEVGDWLTIVRYLEWTYGDDPRDQVAVAGGRLAPLDVVAVADGYTAAIDADAAHAGLHVRAAHGGWSAEIAADDLARPRMIGGRAEREIGGLSLGVHGGVDPRARFGVVAAAGAAKAEHGIVTSTLDAGAGVAPGLGGGGVWLGAGSRARWPAARLAFRLEATAGTDRWVPAPFGPLYRGVQDPGTMGSPSYATRARAGVGGAAHVQVSVRGAFDLEAAMRYRPGFGGEARLGLTAPHLRVVQAGAWLAAAPDLGQWAAAGELRVPIAGRMHAVVEAARLYGTGAMDGLDAARPIWQVTAWFGVHASS